MNSKREKEQAVDDEPIYVKLSDIPYDLMRFNISAKSGSDRREARKTLLMKMGAAPPKREYINYKLILKQKTEAKLKAAQLPYDAAADMANKQIPLDRIKRRRQKRKKDKSSSKQKSKKIKKSPKRKKSRK
ncbi:unnamed protein product [Calicophoron daubneyi]|uniref:Uncharacterized protein n=1 Tax=Calicophoron daubneyi TaxID=300641 RepID=A0AAV2TGS0_CALDB